MRNEGSTFLNQDNSTITVIAYVPQTLIHVRWAYISFLAIQIGLGIIVLLFTIIATYRNRIQILKANSLATICVFSQDVRIELGGMEDMERVKKNAKGMKVRLEMGADGEVTGLDLVSRSNN
jgi:cytochrome c-type biogenesis protein CcmE